jgi:UDP-N-acetyl-D-mannosaminuronic acid dehydrogenase
MPLGDEAESSFLGAARRINDSMPSHVAEIVARLLGEQVRPCVAILGYAYREDSDDARNSPTADLVYALAQRGVEVAIHDPFVEPYRGDIFKSLDGADCAVLMVAHGPYRELDLKAAGAVMRARKFVDARNFFGADALGEAGFEWRVIGLERRP